MSIWNPWHGCRKISAGCKNCYVYRRDAEFGKDSSIVQKTADFYLPGKRGRNRAYKLTAEDGPVYTCMTSDFFIEEADEWRMEIWQMIKERRDLHFVIITKRIHRFLSCIPKDWGEGYENVTIECTCENQEMTNRRLPLFLSLPIRHRELIHEPMLGPIDAGAYLSTGKIEHVTCGGESGPDARLLDYSWVLQVRENCIRFGVPFYFKQTGAHFRKDGKTYLIRRKDQLSQARKAGIDYDGKQTGEQNIGQTVLGAVRERERIDQVLCTLSRSKFRSGFQLKETDRAYVSEKGMDTLRLHAEELLEKRLCPAHIPNDGKQTPMRGHPVFIAQHATACCCRGCLAKWHGIPAGRALSEEEKEYAVDVILEWIRREMRW